MLGHYRVVRTLGAGGMGEVYEALDTRLNRSVALKVIRQDVAADPPRRQRLAREARAAAMLNHPQSMKSSFEVAKVTEICGLL